MTLQQIVSRTRCGVVFVALYVAVSIPARAQDSLAACQWQGSHQWLSTRASPLDSAVLVMPGLTAKVCYSRPSARGRSVFDSLAPFGKTWRTGANEPTMLRLLAEASVGGVRLSQGNYVVMTVPRPQNWVILFFSTNATDPAAMFQSLTPVGQGVGEVMQLETPVETFTISGSTSSGGAALYLEWDRVRVRVPVIPKS